MSKTILCPRCKKAKIFVTPPFPALSRRDNETHICSDCGTREAMEDAGFEPKYIGEIYWKKK